MSPMSVDNSRIAKNTVYLYIRMIFVLGANFFAVRFVDITKDADSERTPRGAMSEDLNAAPLQNQTSFQERRLAHFVGYVNWSYPVSGAVGVLSNSRPYDDQRVVAKFKADSEASSIQGHMQFGESTHDGQHNSKSSVELQGGLVTSKADSEVTFLHERSRIGESAVDAVYDNRFRLILQAAEAYNKV